MFNLIRQLLCQLILLITGWKEPHIPVIIPKKSVIIFPHSSYFDYLIFLVHTYAHPSDFDYINFYVFMTERFSWLFFLSTSIIPVQDRYVRHYMKTFNYSLKRAIFESLKTEFLSLFWRNYKLSFDDEKLKANTVSDTCRLLEDKYSYSLLISPTGSTTNLKWKSGYFNIAKALNVPITVGGINYKEKRLYFLSTTYIDSDFNENQLKKQFERIGTLENNTIIDYTTLTSFFHLLLVPHLFSSHPYLALWNFFTGSISFLYHYYNQTNFIFKILDSISTGISFTFFFYLLWVQLGYSIMKITLVGCLASFYYGRSYDYSDLRKNNYHSMFHLLSLLASTGLLELL